jgi:hypothetical protein
VRDEFVHRSGDQWMIVPETVRADEAIKPLLNDDFLALLKWYRENRVRLEEEYLSADAGGSPE